MAITWREISVLSDAANLDDVEEKNMETIGGFRASKIKAWTFLDTVKGHLKADITLREISELADKMADYVDSQVVEALAKPRAPVAITPNYDPDNPPKGPIPKPEALRD